MSVRQAIETQLDLGLRTSARPLRLSRDLRNVPLDRYRLPKDGRKWKTVARERMGALEWLATYGDADGSRIYPAEKSITHHFGWSRRKTFYILADLGVGGLNYLGSDGRLTSEHGTRVRRINLSAVLRPGVQDSRVAGVQDSRAGVQSKVAHDRHLTDPIKKGRRESNHRFSSNTQKPTSMIVLSPRTIEEKKRTAKTILVEKGFDSDVVEVALLRVANLAAAKGKNPRTPAYFIAGVERSLADEEEASVCRSIAAERRRAGVPIDAPLRPDEWHAASKIEFVHAAVEDADRLGRRASEVAAERLAAVEYENKLWKKPAARSA